MAGYRKIDPRIWYDAKFFTLPQDAKLLFLCLLTHPDLTCVGAMPPPVAPRVAPLLAWSVAKVETTLEELHSLFVRCGKQGLSYFPRYLKYNPPTSPTHISKAWIAALDRLPEHGGRSMVARYCLDFIESCSDSFRGAIPSATLDAIKGATLSATPGTTLGPEAEAEAVIREEKSKNPPMGPPTTNRKTRCKLPEDFELNDERRDFAVHLGIPDPEREFALFADHFRATADLKADWDATWRNWCRNAAPGGRFAPRPATGAADPRLHQSLEEMAAEIEETRQRMQLRQGKAVTNDDLPF